MSTIRFETSPKASPVQGSPLDDYYPSLIIDMDTPNLGGYRDNNAENEDPNDLYAQLAQKEQDLILAAEIGKSLLEKNEELSKANEKLTEDFSQKVEVRRKSSYIFNVNFIFFNFFFRQTRLRCVHTKQKKRMWLPLSHSFRVFTRRKTIFFDSKRLESCRFHYLLMRTSLKAWKLIDIIVRLIIIASFIVTRMYLMDLCVNKLETIYHPIWFTNEKKFDSPPPYLGSWIWKVPVKWEPFSEVHKLFSVIMIKVNGKKKKSEGKKERRCCNHVATHMHIEDKSILMMAQP